MKLSRLLPFILYATSAFAVVPHAHAQSRTADLNAVLSTEKAFAKMAIDSAPQKAFDRYLSADAMVFRPRAIRAMDVRARKPLSPLLALTWQPEFADVSRAGDLAYTTGPYVSGSRRSEADPQFGQYVNVWRKQKDGRWLSAMYGSVVTPADASGPKKTSSPPASSPFVGKGTPQDFKNSLLNADNAFGALSRQRGYGEALKATGLPDLRLLRNIQPLAVGMDSVAATTRNARVTMWMPIEAGVATSGDLGYTRGSYVIGLPAGGTQAGDYLRIWRRNAKGTWQIALDLLSPGR